MDYECDYGYYRSEDGRCVADSLEPAKRNSYGLTED